MRVISIDDLTSGMRLSQPILSENGSILLRQDVVLLESYIRRLKNMNIAYVYIQDAETMDIELEETIRLPVQQQVMAEIKKVYDKMANEKNMLHFLRDGQLARKFTELANILYDHLRSNQTFILNMGAIYAKDAYLYKHSMNVGTLAMALGMASGFNEETIKNFGVGAMLHDIGKLKVSPAILDKPGRLTDEERKQVELHCVFGYEMLISQTELSATSAHCALQHHEKFDGTGYPRGLRGDAIHEFGRLLAVPDVFDALTSNRVYRKAFLPQEAIEFLYAQTGTHFDKRVVDLFKAHVNVYPNGLPVTLSNGTKGIVAKCNPSQLHRPVIRIMEERGRKVRPYDCDLLKQLNVVITSCGFG